MNQESREEIHAVILSQLSGAPAERIAQLSALIEEFIERLIGFVSLPQIDVSILASSNGYKAIQIAVELMNSEIARLGSLYVLELDIVYMKVQRELNEFVGTASQNKLLRVQCAYSDFKSEAIRIGVLSK